MNNWHSIWSFVTKNFRVQLDWTYETDPDLSWADAETIDKLHRGDYVNACFRVGVFYGGELIGADYLGNSVYENVAEFRKQMDGYFPDMVRAAINNARCYVNNMPKLKPGKK